MTPLQGKSDLLSEVAVADENQPDSSAYSHNPDFLLFDEGSFFGLEKSPARMWFDRLTPRQQIVIVVSVTWIPLALLAAIQGVAVGPTQPRSFLEDAGMYARFFVALPMLLVTPSKLAPRFQQIIQHFLSSGVLKVADREHFLAILTSTLRLRYSWVADWVCLAIAYGWSASHVFLPALAPAVSASWRAVGPAGQQSLSAAAWYFVAISQPVYGFVVAHFLYRVGLWWRSLWMISRLDLQLRGAHPDGGGGLMFLGLSLRPCRWPAFALATSLAGGLANVVLATGVSVVSFRYVIGVIAVVITALFAGPLCFFSDQLKGTAFRSSLSHDQAVQEQLRQFEQKWIGQSGQTDMLAVQDFSAVIDLNATVEKAHQMGRLPFRRSQLLELFVAALLPFLPVVALQIPIKDLLMLVKQLLL
jgi:hypothetical protein